MMSYQTIVSMRNKEKEPVFKDKTEMILDAKETEKAEMTLAMTTTTTTTYGKVRPVDTAIMVTNIIHIVTITIILNSLQFQEKEALFTEKVSMTSPITHRIVKPVDTADIVNDEVTSSLTYSQFSTTTTTTATTGYIKFIVPHFYC